jgi:hypothetical protein
MKRIKKSISIEIPPVRLFLEELKAIEKVYKEHFETYKIKTEDFELDSLDELRDIEKAELKNLSFESSNPYIRVAFSPRNATIFSFEDSVNSTGIVTKLKNISDKGITPLRYLSSAWCWVPFNVLFLIFVLLFPPKEYTVAFGIGLASFTGMAIVWILWSYRFATKKHSLIFLTSRRSQRNFFLRNKDQILLSVFSVVIGALISLLALWTKGVFQ